MKMNKELTRFAKDLTNVVWNEKP